MICLLFFFFFSQKIMSNKYANSLVRRGRKWEVAALLAREVEPLRWVELIDEWRETGERREGRWLYAGALARPSWCWTAVALLFSSSCRENISPSSEPSFRCSSDLLFSPAPICQSSSACPLLFPGGSDNLLDRLAIFTLI